MYIFLWHFHLLNTLFDFEMFSVKVMLIIAIILMGVVLLFLSLDSYILFLPMLCQKTIVVLQGRMHHQ